MIAGLHCLEGMSVKPEANNERTCPFEGGFIVLVVTGGY